MNDNRRAVKEQQIEPVAGIWVCEHCGRRIQVVTESEHEKVQPFVCVCGTMMRPGEEHAQVDHDMQDEVVDD